LPSFVLYLFVPPFAGMRVWSRFGIAAALMVTVLAGLGLAAWVRDQSRNGAPPGVRSPSGDPLPRTPLRKQRTTAGNYCRGLLRNYALPLGLVFFLGLVLFESLTIPFGMVMPAPRLVDTWLAQQPGHFAIIQLPYKVALSGPQLYYSLYHHKAVASGYGTFFPASFTGHEQDLCAFPSDRAVDVLVGWQVRYVLLNPDDFSDWDATQAQINSQPRLRLAYEDAGMRAYELTDWKM
jgi:hypothetical protein